MKRRRGFVTVIALFLVGLVTAGLAVAVAAGTADARRTRATAVDAQLRLLLLAAGADVGERSSAWADSPAASWTLALPRELAGFVVRTRVRSTAAGTASVSVTADGEGHHASQQMTWTRANGTWHLAEVALDGD
jgi:hypothetical protein